MQMLTALCLEVCARLRRINTREYMIYPCANHWRILILVMLDLN
jgi:hypothetical protein